MPDIIAHGEEGIVRWGNEKCISCLWTDTKCPLIKTLLEHKIESYAGIHIFSCALYQPDKEHPLFIETQAEKKLADYETQIARLRGLHARVDR